MRYCLLPVLLFLANISLACPMLPQEDPKKSALYGDLLQSTDAMAARDAANALWAHYFTAPDAQAQEWLNSGVERIRLGDYERAKNILSDLTIYCPDYAEGYNQLAFAQFLSSDFESSESNLKRSLTLEPKHFGALAGMALVAQKQNNIPKAKIWIRQALKVHPFLSERYILDIPESSDEL